jgi:sigma-E factor negative regulatory protein RseC
MIEAQARVVAKHDGSVDVVAVRQSACGSCAVKNGCGTSLIAAWFERRQNRFRLRDTLDAEVGDAVVVGLDEGLLQRGALLLYAVPLGGLIGGAVAGDMLFARIGLAAELGAVGAGLLGLMMTLWWVRQRTAGDSTAASDAGGITLLRIDRGPAATLGRVTIRPATENLFRNR